MKVVSDDGRGATHYQKRSSAHEQQQQLSKLLLMLALFGRRHKYQCIHLSLKITMSCLCMTYRCTRANVCHGYIYK